MLLDYLHALNFFWLALNVVRLALNFVQLALLVLCLLQHSLVRLGTPWFVYALLRWFGRYSSGLGVL